MTPSKVEMDDDQLFAIRLQYECPYKWKDMKGDERVRACSACHKNVYNISMLSRTDAVSLINENEGDICVRFFQRRDGTVITRDCVSMFGTAKLKGKYNPFALINAGLAVLFTILAPLLGPACCTILNGVGPVMTPVDKK